MNTNDSKTEALTMQDRSVLLERLSRVLASFKAAQALRHAADRRLQGLPGDEIESFWLAPPGRTERHLQAVAAEVDATFQIFSSGGLVASAADYSIVAEARHHISKAS